MCFQLDKQTGISQCVPTPDDDITIISLKQEYAQDFTVNYCIKLNSTDLIYHVLGNTDKDKPIFRNLPKLWFVVCIYVTDDLDKGWDSHVVGLHKRDKYHFGFG
jgi:hypothetical protein